VYVWQTSTAVGFVGILPVILQGKRRSAAQGHIAGEYNLGRMYFKGEGATKDTVVVVIWYRKTVNQGNGAV
jgi:TPR repeat protein